MKNALSGKPLSASKPTMGFDPGTVKREECVLNLYDVGGGPTIRGIWSNYYASAHAFVFVIDASDHDRFAEARTLLKEAATHESMRGKPMLVLATKQDLPQACSEEEVAEMLHVHELTQDNGSPCYVCGCSLGGEEAGPPWPGLEPGISWLLRSALTDHAVLQARVDLDVAKEKEEAERKKAERKARLAAKRAAREQEEATAAAAPAGEPSSTVHSATETDSNSKASSGQPATTGVEVHLPSKGDS